MRRCPPPIVQGVFKPTLSKHRDSFQAIACAPAKPLCLNLIEGRNLERAIRRVKDAERNIVELSNVVIAA
jgi:hypothetical protein